MSGSISISISLCYYFIVIGVIGNASFFFFGNWALYEQWNLDVESYLYRFMVMCLGAVICALLLLRAGENNIDMSFKQSFRT